MLRHQELEVGNAMTAGEDVDRAQRIAQLPARQYMDSRRQLCSDKEEDAAFVTVYGGSFAPTDTAGDPVFINGRRTTVNGAGAVQLWHTIAEVARCR